VPHHPITTAAVDIAAGQLLAEQAIANTWLSPNSRNGLSMKVLTNKHAQPKPGVNGSERCDEWILHQTKSGGESAAHCQYSKKQHGTRLESSTNVIRSNRWRL